VDHVRPRSMVDRPWTVAPSSSELQPPAVPVSKGAGQGAGEEEWNAGSSVGGSPGRGRQCGSRASRRRGGGQGGLGGEALQHGRGGEESSVRGGMFQGSSGGFYRGRGGGEWPGGERVIPRSELEGMKPPYVCPGCFIHTYSNNMINRFHVP
jgi:hypothetical protein